MPAQRTIAARLDEGHYEIHVACCGAEGLSRSEGSRLALGLYFEYMMRQIPEFASAARTIAQRRFEQTGERLAIGSLLLPEPSPED